MRTLKRLTALLLTLLLCVSVAPVSALAEDDVELTPFFWGYDCEEVNDPIRLDAKFDLSLGWTVNGQLDYYDIGEIYNVSLKKADEDSFITLYDHGQTFSGGEADPEEGAHFLLHLSISPYVATPGEYFVQVRGEKGTFLSKTAQTFLEPLGSGPNGEYYPLGFAVEPYFFLEDDFSETVSEIPIGKTFALSLWLGDHPEDVEVIEIFSEDWPIYEYALYENGRANYGGKLDEYEGPGFITGISSASFQPGAYYLKVITHDNGDGTMEPVIKFTGKAGDVKKGPVIANAAPPEGKEGEAYSYTFKATPGYGGAITWSLTDGSLPTGLTLNAKTGVISGTPTVGGTFSFTLKATETGGSYSTVTKSITVKGVPTFRLQFNLNGGKAAAGADYSPKNVKQDEKIALPAAPSKSGYRFVYWENGGTYYLPGAEYTVTADATFNATYTAREPLKVTLPKGFDSVVGTWLIGTHANGSSEFLWSQGRNQAPDVQISPFSLRNTTFTKLEFFGYVNGESTLLASYAGEIDENTESVTLVSSGAEWQIVTGLEVPGLKPYTDYSVNTLTVQGMNPYSGNLRMPCMVRKDTVFEVRLNNWRTDAANQYDLGATYTSKTVKNGLLVVEPLRLSDSAAVTVKAELDGQTYTGALLATQTVNGTAHTAWGRYDYMKDAFVLYLYPGIETRFSYYQYEGIYIISGGTLAAPKNGAPHTVEARTGRLDAQIAIETDADPVLAARYISTLHKTYVLTASKKDNQSRFAATEDIASGINDLLTLNVPLSTEYIPTEADCNVTFYSGFTKTTSTATAKLTKGEGSVKMKAQLRPGVVVPLSSENTARCRLAWFDAAGKFIGSDGGIFLPDPVRDYASSCPANKAGTYTVALTPYFWFGDTYLKTHTLDELAEEGMLFKSWRVTLSDTGVQMLEGFRVDAVTSENTRYATRPYSELHANQKSFSTVSDVLSFTGTVGLDPGLSNGKLKYMLLEFGYTDVTGDTATTLSSVVINGVTYPATKWKIWDYSYGLELPEPVELPCTYTVYATPKTAAYDTTLSITATVSFDDAFGTGHNELHDQKLGDATVSRPGASISVFSTYICGDTAPLTGTVKPGENVKIYDNGNLVAEATGRDGTWAAAAPLDGIDGTYTTVHSLQAVSDSGVTSNTVTVIHRKNGPQLKALNLVLDGTEYADTYFFVSSMTGAKTLKYHLVFEHPEELAAMDEWGGAQAAVKIYLGSGDVKLLPCKKQADGSFIADLGQLGHQYINGAEAIYRPKNGPEDYKENKDGSVTCLPTEKEAEENKALLAALRQYLTVDKNGKITFTGLTDKQSLRVQFADGKATVSGGLYDGATKDQKSNLTKNFGDVLKAFSDAGVRLQEISSGIPDGMNLLEWLDHQSDAKIAANKEAGDKAKVSVSQRTQIFSTAAAFENTKKLLARYAVDPAYSDYAAAKNHTVFQYSSKNATDLYTISDCVYDEDGKLVSGTYSVNVILTADTGSAPAVYTACVTATFSPAFKGYAGLKAPGGSKKSSSALSLLVVTANASQVDTSAFRMSYDGKFEDEPAYESSSTAESFSADFSNLTGGVGGFISSGAKLSGFMSGFGNGLGAVSTGASIYNLKKTYDNGTYRIGTRLKMQWDLEYLTSSTCYKRLTQSKRQLVDEAVNKFKKAQKKEETVDGWYTGLGLGINVGSAICNTVGATMGEFGADWAVAGLGVTGLGVLNGATLGKAMNKARNNTIRQYEESYRTIKSIFQSHAMQTGLDDCKHLEKDDSNSKTNEINHDPSGVVYEGVIENPVKDATVTLWYGVDADGALVLEKNAKAVKQVIPASEVRKTPQETVQVTGADGKFAWFVPQGLWYVTAEKAGLSGNSNADRAATVKVSGVKAAGKTVTNLLPVLPEQLDVNIPLIDKTAPDVESVLYTTDGIYLTFSKYMVDTAKGADSVLNAANYTLKTKDGAVAIAEVKTIEQGHTPANIDGKNAKTYTRTVLLVPKTALKAGTQALVTVKKGVKSYAGSAMAAGFADSGTVQAMKALSSPVIAGGAKQTLSYGAPITITLPKGAPANAKICYTTDGSEPTAESKLYEAPVSATNKMTLKAIAVCPGYPDSKAAAAEILIAEAQQYSVGGEIRGEGDLSGLAVTLSGKDYKKTAKTLSDGSFIFESVPVGSYTLSFAGNDAYRAASAKVEITTYDPWVTLKPVSVNETPDYTPGDVDNNGTIEAADARLALRRAVDLETFPEGSAEYLACDVDGAPGVTAADARLILRAAVGLEDAATWKKQ